MCVIKAEHQCSAKDRTGEEKITRTRIGRMLGRLWWVRLPLSSLNRQREVTLYEILAWMHDCRVLYAYFMNIYEYSNGWFHVTVELFQCRVAVTAMCHCNIMCIYSKGVDTEWMICILEGVRIVFGTEIYISPIIILLQTYRIRIKY